MAITVFGVPYAVAKATGSAVNVRIKAGDWKIFKRKKNETDGMLQKRVDNFLAGMDVVRCPASIPSQS